MQQSDKAEKQHLVGIQIMRGVAASMVVIHHSFLAVSQYGHWNATPIQLQLVQAGASGVDLFFVISGFIMAYVSAGNFGRAGASTDFLIRRAIRIVPLYWIISAILLLGWLTGVILQHLILSTSDVACSFAFLPCVQAHGTPSTTHPLLDQGWTLSYEWYFYLVFAVWLRIGSMRSLVLVLPPIFALVVTVAHFLPGTGTVRSFFADPLTLEFCFGLILAYAVGRGFRPGKLAGTAAIVLGIICLIVGNINGFDEHSGFRWIFWGIPALLIIMGSLSIPTMISLPGRFLVTIGDISYSLYLIHGILTMMLAHLLQNGALKNAPLPLIVVFTYLASLTIAYLCFRFVEAPVTAALQNFYRSVRRRGLSSAIPVER